MQQSMTFHPGAKLGAYEIVAPLGAGGMRFLMRAERGTPNTSPLTLILNWKPN